MKNKIMTTSMAVLAMTMGIGNLDSTTLVKPVQAEEMQQATRSENAGSLKLIDEKTSWKYLDTNEDPGTSQDLKGWTKANYDDSQWKSGVGTFGAKQGQLKALGTVTPQNLLTQYYVDVNDVDGDDMTDDNVNIPAYFFRTTFDVEDVSSNKVLKGEIQYDDGAIVYLNGKAIAYFGGAELDEAANPTTNLYYLAKGEGSEGGSDPAKGTFVIKGSELAKGKNVIAVEIHNKTTNSSDVFFGMNSLTLETVDTSSVNQNDVILTIGSDETQRNLTWYADAASEGTVQVAKANGADTFPKEYKEFNAVASISNEGLYTNQATITGLDENTKYVYRLVNGDTVSKTFSFETGSSNDFSFALVGDPQIGAGSAGVAVNTEKWQETLGVIKGLDVDFLLSAGDQVNTASNETQYDGFIRDELSSLAIATAIGNHDSGSDAYSEHYNLPNESTELGMTTAGGDYYFVYNNTLFIGINSNDQAAAEHQEFIKTAIQKNPDVKWKTVFFHHSIYSSATHWDDNDIVSRRDALPSILAECDIDVVLMGHDHIFTRAYMSDVNGIPDVKNGGKNEAYNPEGILYLTANSASGSKFYTNCISEAAVQAYAEVSIQNNKRTITDVSVTDNSYTLTTYELDDDGKKTQIDTYTIYKTDKAELETSIQKAESLIETQYTADSWNVLEKALEAAKIVLGNKDVKQNEIDSAIVVLDNAITSLKNVDTNTDVKDDNTDVKDDNADVKDDNTDIKDDNTNVKNDNTDVKDDNTVVTPVVKPEDDKTSTIPETGDTTQLEAMALMMIAASGTAIIINKKKKESEVE